LPTQPIKTGFRTDTAAGNASALCRICNLAAKMLQIGQRPLESPKINPSRRHLTLRTLTTDVRVDRADDPLPKELRG